MTVNELTETLKAKGYIMAEYTFWKSNIIFSEVTYTSYLKDGKLAIETKGVKGTGEIEVDFYPFNGNFCIFEEREENNDRGLQMDGKEEEERV